MIAMLNTLAETTFHILAHYGIAPKIDMNITPLRPTIYLLCRGCDALWGSTSETCKSCCRCTHHKRVKCIEQLNGDNKINSGYCPSCQKSTRQKISLNS